MFKLFMFTDLQMELNNLADSTMTIDITAYINWVILQCLA